MRSQNNEKCKKYAQIYSKIQAKSRQNIVQKPCKKWLNNFPENDFLVRFLEFDICYLSRFVDC